MKLEYERLRHPLAWVLIVATCLGGCGEDAGTVQSSDVPPSANTTLSANTPEPVLVAHVYRCTVKDIHDTGVVAYVVVSADTDCAAATAVNFALQLSVNKLWDSSWSAPYFAEVIVTIARLGTPQHVDIPVMGSRTVTVLQEGQWLQIRNEGSWAPRDGAGLLVKGSKVFLLGGWLHGPTTNEVWVSEDLRQWTFLGYAPWPPRHGAAWLVHQDRLYVIGGDMIDDVWSSADGVEWRQETDRAEFGRRYTPNAVSLGGKIIVYAGQSWEPLFGMRDVWESSDGGRSWELANPSAPWDGRGLIHGSIVFQNEIYLIGGGLTNGVTSTEFTDIWTSVDGKSWQKKLDAFSFLPRTHFSVLSTPSGCFVSDGSIGTQANVSNELLYAADCLNYTEIPDPPLQRRHASSVAYFNGTVVILGGPPVGGAGTDVWQYVP